MGDAGVAPVSPRLSSSQIADPDIVVLLPDDTTLSARELEKRVGEWERQLADTKARVFQIT